MFESIPDNGNIVLITLLNKKNFDLLTECDFLKTVINILCLRFRNTRLEQNQDYHDYKRNKEESIIEKNLEKMEDYFATMLEDVRHERLLVLLLPLTDLYTLRRSKFTNKERYMIKTST